MTRFLLTQPAFDRLQPQLAEFADRLEFLTMDAAGVLHLDGQEITPADARPECGLISNDLFSSAHGALYFDLMKSLPSLKWVHSVGAGYDHPVFLSFAENGARMTTTHSQAVGMADYVIWGVLNHFQNGHARAVDQAEHRWERRQAREMMDSKWLILGFGSIGQGVARRARGFGAHVTGVRRNTAQLPDVDALITPDQISDHLGDSDVVVCCMPATPQTVDLVDAKFLAAMKPGSVIVNVGRGTAIVDDALLAALDAGTPEHAVLDVFRTEPLPDDSPFWDHPRVTLTPHNSGSTAGVAGRADELFIDNIARYLAGEDLLNEISAADVLSGATRR